MSRYCWFLLLLLLVSRGFAQTTFPDNGVRNASHNFDAFVNATVHTEAGVVMRGATLLVRDGKITAVGNEVTIPEHAVIHDCEGLHLYPSFIDPYSAYGMPPVKPKDKLPGYQKPQYESKKKGAYAWNEAVKAELNAHELFAVDKERADRLRKLGFGAVATHQMDGIFRGSSVLVSLGSRPEQEVVLKDRLSTQLSFQKGRSRQSYPNSLMGSIALIRQTYYDAQWYADAAEKREHNLTLEAVNEDTVLPAVIEVRDYLSALRADRIGDEFGQQWIIRGSGDEYKRIDEIVATNADFILPLNFPLPYDVRDPYDALNVSLEQMKHWEMAPANPAFLADHDVDFAFTLHGLKKQDDFWKQLQVGLDHGLEKEEMLRALTTAPAQMFGVEDMLGQLSPGYVANFLITTEELVHSDMVILENWVQGRPYVINEGTIDIRGVYNLNVNKNGGAELTISGTLMNPKATMSGKHGKNVKVTIKRNGHQVTMTYPIGKDGAEGRVRLSGNINDDDSRIWSGHGTFPDGTWIEWAAIRQKDKSQMREVESQKDTMEFVMPAIQYPNRAYGWDSLPQQKIVIFKHATVWTNEDTGIVENYDVAIADGKILAVGPKLSRVGLFGDKDLEVEIVEARGKHITSGIIDEHSHIALSRGVNESGQAISAEVRIGDVINPDDINIYRQLAGGVTASQLLHGSANPIGGQSALVKMRWGAGAEAMKIEGADGFIKFALGENVKQSNWGKTHTSRFPQTRMGVEQVYYDAFMRAREYGEVWHLHDAAPKKKKSPSIPPRRDLELDALAEILDSTRFITCHSYVQSEINMLMHVADSMGFRVNTFTHILEGYKVADKMKTHGVGASTFSDWWAYKFEVNDAIPYNAALLNEQGVLTAINSDDAEMGRRLNQEAAKVVKYGGVSEEDAWKMVTLNPAKMLHLDDRMGSIKEGKDADIVIWSDHPLSIRARVEATYIDGRRYYERSETETQQTAIQAERNRLIQKMLKELAAGKKAQKAEAKKQKLYHCESIE